jgi:prepilin-type N-terminal cleavage/methylation domain-containing protein
MTIAWMQRSVRVRGLRAFTLVELLTVIALIAILAAILIPTLAGARTAANRTRTRVQFGQWVMAVEAFRQEYGGYPEFDPSGKVNGGASSVPSAEHRFHDVLAGRRRDGSALPAAVPESAAAGAQNFRRMHFLAFAEGDFFPSDDPIPAQRNLLRDGFESPEMAVLVDRNLDGIIDQEDYAELPAVEVPEGNGRALRPRMEDFGGGVRAGVMFYSAPPRALDVSQLICSWK